MGLAGASSFTALAGSLDLEVAGWAGGWGRTGRMGGLRRIGPSDVAESVASALALETSELEVSVGVPLETDSGAEITSEAIDSEDED